MEISCAIKIRRTINGNCIELAYFHQGVQKARSLRIVTFQTKLRSTRIRLVPSYVYRLDCNLLDNKIPVINEGLPRATLPDSIVDITTASDYSRWRVGIRCVTEESDSSYYFMKPSMKLGILERFDRYIAARSRKRFIPYASIYLVDWISAVGGGQASGINDRSL